MGSLTIYFLPLPSNAALSRISCACAGNNGCRAGRVRGSWACVSLPGKLGGLQCGTALSLPAGTAAAGMRCLEMQNFPCERGELCHPREAARLAQVHISCAQPRWGQWHGEKCALGTLPASCRTAFPLLCSSPRAGSLVRILGGHDPEPVIRGVRRWNLNPSLSLHLCAMQGKV